MFKRWKHIMQGDWDAMGRQNPKYYVFTSKEFADPLKGDSAKFFESGKVDVDDILEALHVQSNRTWAVLDVGCGLGRMTRRLSELFGTVVGIDVSHEMLKRAREWNPSISFIRTSGIDMREFKDSSFDLVFSFIVFQHLPSLKLLKGYLTEIARVLKPGGIALFQMPTSFFPSWKRLYWKMFQAEEITDPNRKRPSFRGTIVGAGVIQKWAFQLGFVVEAVLFEGTPYTYFRLSKWDARLIGEQKRSAGESRIELAKLKGKI